MYNNYDLRLFCELGLAKSLTDLVQEYHKNSKFGGFLKRIEKECIKIQNKALKKPSEFDVDAASIKLEDFGRSVKWINKKMSPNIMFCFVMRLLEESKFLEKKNEKLIDTMSKLIQYRDDAGLIQEAHYIEGDLAYTIWLSVWDEKDEDKYDPNVLKKQNIEIERKQKLEEYNQIMYGK